MYHFDYLDELKLSTSATLSHISLCFVYFCLISNCISLWRCLFNWHIKKSPYWKCLAILQRQLTFMQDLGVWFFNNMSFPLQSHRLVPESAGPAPSPLSLCCSLTPAVLRIPSFSCKAGSWYSAVVLPQNSFPTPFYFCFCYSY